MKPIEEEKKGGLMENRGRAEKRRSREQLDQLQPRRGQECTQTFAHFTVEDIRSRFEHSFMLTLKVGTS